MRPVASRADPALSSETRENIIGIEHDNQIRREVLKTRSHTETSLQAQSTLRSCTSAAARDA